MDESDLLAERFEVNRTHLRAVGYRMLGSISEADDAVQEAWLRLSGADTSAVDNLEGWLTTVVARVCLDMLRSRKSRHEQPLGIHVPDPIVDHQDGSDPEHQALIADAVGLALLVVLDTLTPAERLAFVLHDLFALSFDEIAPIVERSPPRPGSSPAAHAAVSGDGPPSPTLTSTASEQSSMPSWPPHARATSTLCSNCSTPTSSSEPTPAPSRRARRDRCAGLKPSQREHAPSRAWRGWHDRRSSTEPPDSSSLNTASPSPSRVSPSRAARLSRSTSSPTPNASARSTSRCSSSKRAVDPSLERLADEYLRKLATSSVRSCFWRPRLARVTSSCVNSGTAPLRCV